MEGIDESDFDKKVWSFKLQLYNNDEKVALQYSKDDEFCHEFVIFGYCTNRYNQNQPCSRSHSKNPIRIQNGNTDANELKHSRLLTEYLLYVYDNKDSKASFENYNLFVSNLKSYKGTLAAIDGKLDIAK